VTPLPPLDRSERWRAGPRDRMFGRQVQTDPYLTHQCHEWARGMGIVTSCPVFYVDFSGNVSAEPHYQVSLYGEDGRVQNHGCYWALSDLLEVTDGW